MFAASFKVTTVALVTTSALAAPVKRDGSGTATYYYTGFGSCGWNSKDSEYVVAVNSAQFNGGSHCGKHIGIYNKKTGNMADATIVDECPTCERGSIDLSRSLFGYLNNGDMDAGTFPVIWWME